MNQLKYDKMFDRWSVIHIISGWILAFFISYIFQSPAFAMIIGPILVLIWEYLENIYIKPTFFKTSPIENGLNIFSDVIWGTLGILLFIIPNIL